MVRLARFLIYIISLFSIQNKVISVEILSKSKLEKCEKRTGSDDNLNCTTKIVINMAVPSGSSGREASVVAEIVEVEENSSNMQTLRVPPVITVNKSAAYAFYALTYIRDVAYKPQEFFVKTRKCHSDAGANVVQICERLRDEAGHVIEHTQPICCPCVPRRQAPSSCGNIFDKLIKGKANTAHCLRFSDDWSHVFGIGQQSIGFSVRIEMKTGNKVSEVIVGPENRTATSEDNFLRVNLIGDFGGYSSIPTFEDFYLVIPRQGGPGQPNDLGRNISMWMLLKSEIYLRCCLHNQLWNFWEADQNRMKRTQTPLYGVQGRYERINEHPGAGSRSFSIGVTEVLNTNLLIELRADDIDFVFQRSPGKIMSVTVPTFEALTQFGVATITVMNTGEVEASYSLTFDCSKGVALMEEQFFIMKPEEISARSFKVYPTTDQAAKYVCSAILKDSEFSEADRAECQFSTTATVLDNGSQIAPFQPPKTGDNGFFESLKKTWKNLWESLVDFISGETCRRKCSGFFDFSCHIQYICMSWIVLFGLLLAIFPTVLVLLWLLHQKGFFDPLYDWFEDHFGLDDHKTDIHRHGNGNRRSHIHTKKHIKTKYHKHDSRYNRSGIHHDRRRNHSERESDYHHYLHHVHKEKHKHKHRHVKSSSIMHEIQLDRRKHDVGHHKHRRVPAPIERPLKLK
ncbi:GENERATIVE CELL-SPECIFIC 1, HAPLESS 2 [Hibiscus trionum]|uniref:GENERATIVE CELL-SPECIFIC 1, HAPLESS 2 n=1 Tax=Hibiscus trionum TaxID=183268 RepID=A0A9W7IWG1_HIBTR|nr:GENERATIVE CELL-SPECIFIC 1, HAPLESS 2 [Hibiscus trionum]